MVVTPVSDGHGRTSDSELSYIEVAAAAEAELRSFVYDLGTEQFSIETEKHVRAHGVELGTHLVKGREYIIRKLNLSNGRMPHRR